MIIYQTHQKSKERKEEKELEDAWATLIKSRDNWCCVICGSDYKPNAHHIIPREHKQYKFEENNGITLCTKHHKFLRSISAHNNPFGFFLWLQRFAPTFFAVATERTKTILKTEGILI